MVAKKNKTKSKSSDSSKTNLKGTDPNLYFGAGEFTLPNGDVYAGDYGAHRSGLIWREGHGLYRTQDGQTYEGLWHDDKLVEGKEILITYPNGAKYCGALLKSKYNGPGTYILESNMSLSCDFVANKPSGLITLVDQEGILWRGVAKENSALLLPENIFYLNLTEDRGKGLSKEPLNVDLMHPSTSTLTNENKEEELSDREWEKIIFAKSKLTEENVDFTDCKWWRNYEEFKRKYDEIKTKIDDEISLDKEDYVWIERFKKYKRKQQMKKDLKKSRWKREVKRVLALNEKYRAKDFNESCPPVDVFYPGEAAEDNKSDKMRKSWNEQQVLQSEQLATESANIIIVGSDGVLLDQRVPIHAQVIKRASSRSDSLETSSSNSENQMVQFKEPSIDGRVSKSLLCADESEELELHFSSFRQDTLLEKQNELRKQIEFEAKKSRSLKDASKSNLEVRKKESRQDSRGKKSETLTPIPKSLSEIEKQNSYPQSLVTVTRQNKREERVRECVREMLAKRQGQLVEKKEDPMKLKERAHTHNVAAHTESLAGIPRELLLDVSKNPKEEENIPKDD